MCKNQARVSNHKVRHCHRTATLLTTKALSTATNVPNGSRNLSKDYPVNRLWDEVSTHCLKLMPPLHTAAF